MSEGQILAIASLLRERKLARYMQFLLMLCECKGVPVLRNQKLIVETVSCLPWLEAAFALAG